MRAMDVFVWVCLGTVMLLEEMAVKTVQAQMINLKWYRVMMEPSRLLGSAQYQRHDMDKMRCASFCNDAYFCWLWCHDARNGCQMSQMIVSGSYTPSDTQGALVCYTIRPPPEFAVNSIITSSPEQGNTSLLKYLEDGVWTYNHTETPKLAPSKQPWFLVDMQRVVRVSRLIMLVYPDALVPSVLSDVEVRVGLNLPPTPGDFQSYTRFYKAARASGMKNTVIFYTNSLTTGRFVSIQKMSDGILSMSHLEIH